MQVQSGRRSARVWNHSFIGRALGLLVRRWYDKCGAWPFTTLIDPMADIPRGARPDPVAREVDRLLEQLSYSGSRAVPYAEQPRPERRPRTPVPTRAKPAPNAMPSARRFSYDIAGLWVRVGLSATLGVLMTQWPYRHECGWPLMGYFGAVSTVMLSGAWIGFTSWRLRSGFAHLVALVLFFWGIVLAAEQLLPRIGYAALEAAWRCR